MTLKKLTQPVEIGVDIDEKLIFILLGLMFSYCTDVHYMSSRSLMHDDGSCLRLSPACCKTVKPASKAATIRK